MSPFVAAPAELTIIDRGRSDYRIVLPVAASPSERYAAAELQRYLRLLGGVELQVVTDTGKSYRREILLGDHPRLTGGTVDPAVADLGSDGFVLKTRGQSLSIAGGKPRGTLYGVYTLLEEYFGVRWFTPELEIVPGQRCLRLPRLDRRVVPALEYREVFWTEMMRDGDFAARHRLNGDHLKLTEKHGGAAVSYFPFVHSFDALIPPELFASHPEYFPWIARSAPPAGVGEIPPAG